MKPLSERDENIRRLDPCYYFLAVVGMKPLSERDENLPRTTVVAKNLNYL